jgi:hypothetical protein
MLLPITGILLAGTGIAIGWFAARREMPDTGQKGDPNKVAEEAMLENDAQAEWVLRLAGFDEAFVYRWRGAALDGYVVVDTPQGTERKPLGPIPKNGAKVDPSFRGLLVLAVRPKVAGVAGRECIWAWSTEEKTKEGITTKPYSRPQSVRLPDIETRGNGSNTSREAWQKLWLPGGKERELFNLKLLKPQ